MFVENLTPFFRDYGETVTLNAGGVSRQINGIFNAPTQMRQTDRADVINVEANIQVKTSDTTGARINDTITRKGITYYIVDYIGDEAITIFYLSEDAA